MCARAVALCCAVLVAVGAAAAYTVDCNHEYTDCDTELSKIADEDELPTLRSSHLDEPVTTTTTSTTISTPKIPETIIENKTKQAFVEHSELPEVTEEIKPKPRLLNLNVDELQNFANALHNQSDKSSKKLTDLSDVTLDDDDEEPPKINDHHQHPKDSADKFYSNLQEPFHPLISGNRESDELETCRDNEIGYKVGEKVERGCEETCECTPGGTFDCSPRCKHPYIRRGRRLNDPLCFESPVDDCCSIIACATDQKVTKLEVCKYANETHPVGTRWYIGCETTCSCEPNSVVTCKPRCKPIIPSEKCINVQDPNDACCEVQVCDVSQDDHEFAENSTSTTTTTTTSQPSRFFDDYEEGRANNRPLVLAEPIGSIKVLQNNSVQVNLMHLNDTKDPIHLLLSDDAGKTFHDVELKYSNLILNLQGGKDYILKTKETGTKFNFTITTSDATSNSVDDLGNHPKAGCYEDGKFYEIGEEFRIGCTELCECTGPDNRECVALVCPNHVGLEIMSKGCVKWAPSPPAQPPNCCPRSARCLSDGTCHYNGVPVPNWSEVPLSLTGCEQRCFCENGDLDCQLEVCTPLPPVPPQSLRCPPMHRPAAVNISDEDCCKQWGCVPNGTHGSSTYSMPVLGQPINYVTSIPPIIPTYTTQVLPPPLVTEPVDLYMNLNPFQSFPKFQKTVTPMSIPKYGHNESGQTNPNFKYIHNDSEQNYRPGDNITVFTLDDIESPFKTIQAEPPLVTRNDYWSKQTGSNKVKTNSFRKPHVSVSQITHTHPEKHVNFVLTNNRVQDIMHQHPISQSSQPQKVILKTIKPTSSKGNVNYFSPTHEKIWPSASAYYEHDPDTSHGTMEQTPSGSLFEPAYKNKSDYILYNFNSTPPNSLLSPARHPTTHNLYGKHVTILKAKDLRTLKQTEGSNFLWNHDTKTHVLTKQPNPYETVLLRAIPSSKFQTLPMSSQKLHSLQVPGKAYSAIDLEHLLNQMEVQSEVNRNLGRSADKKQGDGAGHISPTPPELSPHQPQSPSFLPTIPPEPHYHSEDIPDYDQNNIHRPPPPGHPGLPDFPPELQLPPNFGDTSMNKKLSVISIEADSPTSIKMLLGLPPVLVGLRGSVDLRYTDKADEDISHWYSQVFAPADEILTTPRLEFRLTGLKPGTIYKVKGKLFLHNLPVSPESETYTVRTSDLPTMVSVEEKRREIVSGLTVAQVNDTVALVSWRHFTEEELQYIDGIQVRYRPVGTPIYSMTELLHHSRSAAELHDLRPGSRYEASLVLIPPPRATTELHDPGMVEFTTAPYIDPYNWTVIVEVRSIGAEAAELTWRGVPSPAERWVRVYRAAHACGENQAAGKEHDEFRLAARDQPPSVTLSGLEPDSRCRVWLELFLTNGKVKISNVLEINTKSLDTDNPIDNEIEASSQSGSRSGRPRGDYYTALVGVGVVAALGALTSLLLLLVVVRRHRPRSVPITPVPTAPRESSLPPYDNPAYKLELQQETMDL